MTKHTLIYDGSCGVCSGSVLWLKRFDWLDKFSLRPLQDEALYREYPTLTPERCEEAMQVILRDGRIFEGADALREALLRLPVGLPFGLLLALPPFRQIARRFYPVFARNRHRVSGVCGLKRP